MIHIFKNKTMQMQKRDLKKGINKSFLKEKLSNSDTNGWSYSRSPHLSLASSEPIDL